MNSPLQFMRLAVAIMLDIMGGIIGFISWLGIAGEIWALVWVASILSFIPDILGFLLLNNKLLGGSSSKKDNKKFLISFILELTPLGSFFIWTIYVITGAKK